MDTRPAKSSTRGAPVAPLALIVLSFGLLNCHPHPAAPHQNSYPPAGYGAAPRPAGGHGPAQGAAGAKTAPLPPAVRAVLEQYLNILRTSRSVAECASRLVPIAGGGLVNEDGRSLRRSVPPYSLKKDFNNVRFYARPTRITRVSPRRSNGEGFGPSAIRGLRYTVYIAKASGQPGMPAPISIMVPDRHAFVQGPRIVGIGSL